VCEGKWKLIADFGFAEVFSLCFEVYFVTVLRVEYCPLFCVGVKLGR